MAAMTASLVVVFLGRTLSGMGAVGERERVRERRFFADYTPSRKKCISHFFV